MVWSRVGGGQIGEGAVVSLIVRVDVVADDGDRGESRSACDGRECDVYRVVTDSAPVRPARGDLHAGTISDGVSADETEAIKSSFTRHPDGTCGGIDPDYIGDKDRLEISPSSCLKGGAEDRVDQDCQFRILCVSRESGGIRGR